MQALREHCSLSGHDPSKAPKPSKQKQSLAAVQPAVPLELTVQPVPDQVEMERCSRFPATQHVQHLISHSACLVVDTLNVQVHSPPYRLVNQFMSNYSGSFYFHILHLPVCCASRRSTF